MEPTGVNTGVLRSLDADLSLHTVTMPQEIITTRAESSTTPASPFSQKPATPRKTPTVKISKTPRKDREQDTSVSSTQPRSAAVDPMDSSADTSEPQSSDDSSKAAIEIDLTEEEEEMLVEEEAGEGMSESQTDIDSGVETEASLPTRDWGRVPSENVEAVAAKNETETVQIARQRSVSPGRQRASSSKERIVTKSSNSPPRESTESGQTFEAISTNIVETSVLKKTEEFVDSGSIKQEIEVFSESSSSDRTSFEQELSPPMGETQVIDRESQTGRQPVSPGRRTTPSRRKPSLLKTEPIDPGSDPGRSSRQSVSPGRPKSPGRQKSSPDMSQSTVLEPAGKVEEKEEESRHSARSTRQAASPGRKSTPSRRPSPPKLSPELQDDTPARSTRSGRLSASPGRKSTPGRQKTTPLPSPELDDTASERATRSQRQKSVSPSRLPTTPTRQRAKKSDKQEEPPVLMAETDVLPVAERSTRNTRQKSVSPGTAPLTPTRRSSRKSTMPTLEAETPTDDTTVTRSTRQKSVSPSKTPSTPTRRTRRKQVETPVEPEVSSTTPELEQNETRTRSARQTSASPGRKPSTPTRSRRVKSKNLTSAMDTDADITEVKAEPECELEIQIPQEEPEGLSVSPLRRSPRLQSKMAAQASLIIYWADFIVISGHIPNCKKYEGFFSDFLEENSKFEVRKNAFLHKKNAVWFK